MSPPKNFRLATPLRVKVKKIDSNALCGAKLELFYTSLFLEFENYSLEVRKLRKITQNSF